ncbi:MAG: patatin-like phospholipase family protein [Planctomycetes bacterium]|nr:patatin-like phospholipase family protein [Planctomycetota bacterium]
MDLIPRNEVPLRLPGQTGRRRPRTVLVLGGGGMRGMAHVGVLRALHTLGIGYDAIVGTSIGSLVGAMAAAGMNLDEMGEIVARVQKEDYFRLNFVKFLMKGTRAPSMYRGDTFRERLTEILPQRGFDQLEVPFYCNAVRLESGGSVFFGTPGFDHVSLVDAVYASCALPGVFEPFELDGYNYMDGGIVDAVPLRFAKTLEPELIIAVDLTIKSTFKTPNYKSRVLSTLYRSFEIVEEVLVEHSLHMHVDWRTVLIQPKVGHLARFDFDDVPSIVKMGEDEALRVLTSHAATRNMVPTDRVVPGLSCPATPRDYVSVRIDPMLCIGCGMCEMVCETDAFWAGDERASVRKLMNYECTRDHACARNCPTSAISLGNL